MPRLLPVLSLPRSVRRRMIPVLPARRWATKLRAALDSDGEWEAYQALQGVWPARDAARLCGRSASVPPWPPSLLERLESAPPWLRYRLLDAQTFLPERVLAKVDRASMDHSLEVRVPLLDHRIVELLLTLPPELARGKRVLRRALERLGAPKPRRRKRGFEVPLSGWLRGPLRDRVHADLLGSTSRNLGLDTALLVSRWDDHQSGRADHAEGLLAAAVLVRWAERWL